MHVDSIKYNIYNIERGGGGGGGGKDLRRPWQWGEQGDEN